ncbi:unnamed protein product, partial [Porites evermanni]
QELSGTDADQSLEVLESIDRDVSEDEAADAEPNENLTRAETSKSDHPLAALALPDNKEISSLKIEELKAELDKRGYKKSGNKCTLVQRLRDAIVSEKLGSQTIETDTTFSQIESPANGQDNPRVDDIYSFIEIKVKEVCQMRSAKPGNHLKQEASTSYSNETISSLREENNLLNIRLQELQSRNDSLREEARTLSDENKSLMTVIRLLNNQAATKEDGRCYSRNADNGSSGNLHINQQGQGIGQCQKKPNTVTQQRKATETEKKSEHFKQSKQQTRATPAGRTAEATSFPTKSENDRITVVVGDSIMKNLQGRKLAKAVGHRVVVKAFPGATIHDMKSHIILTVERCPDQICLHIGTNDLKSKEPNVAADAIVDLAREIENSCDAETVLSEITTRNDAHSDAVKTVNRRLKQFSRQNGWKLISHANITQNGLNKGGLHLNREGNDSLHRNFFAFKGHSTKTYRNFSIFDRENFRRDISRQDWSSIKSNNPQDWAMYKRLRNRINGEVKSTKASYYASAFVQSNGDSCKTWQLINELTSRQKNNASVKELKLNENSVTNSHELSNAFNDHFSTIGTKLANEVPLVTDGSSYADYIVS